MKTQHLLGSVRFLTTLGHLICILLLFSTYKVNVEVGLADNASSEERILANSNALSGNALTYYYHHQYYYHLLIYLFAFVKSVTFASKSLNKYSFTCSVPVLFIRCHLALFKLFIVFTNPALYRVFMHIFL